MSIKTKEQSLAGLKFLLKSWSVLWKRNMIKGPRWEGGWVGRSSQRTLFFCSRTNPSRLHVSLHLSDYFLTPVCPSTSRSIFCLIFWRATGDAWVKFWGCQLELPFCYNHNQIHFVTPNILPPPFYVNCYGQLTDILLKKMPGNCKQPAWQFCGYNPRQFYLSVNPIALSGTKCARLSAVVVGRLWSQVWAACVIRIQEYACFHLLHVSG